jgi:hypothetical protein
VNIGPMLEAAIGYCSDGLSVFPCKDKKPLTINGFKAASLDASQIHEWWEKWPDAQVALPTGSVNNLFVLDVDGPDGERVTASLNLPETFTVATREGHFQMWFRQPEGTRSKCTTRVLGPEIDTRGDGGYVIAPPSIHHETGKPYRILKRLPWAVAPAAILEPRKSPATGHGHESISLDVHEGQGRHKALLSMAGSMRARGCDANTVLASLKLFNDQFCHPPVEQSWLEKTARYIDSKPAGSRGVQMQEASVDVELKSFSQIAPESVSWIWSGRIPAAKLSLFVGNPAAGKSLATIDIAARVSSGRAFPDGATCVRGDVLILTSEDGIADTVRPRLDAAGADVSRVHCIESVKVTRTDGQIVDSSFSLQRDLANLEKAFEKNPGFKLIIFDPLSAYLGSVNSWRDSEVRALLTPLCEFAERTGVANVGIMHLRKSETDAMLRVSGSIAFVAAARAAWGFGPDPEDPSRRIMTPVKSNLSAATTSLGYQIVSNAAGVPYLEWDASPRDVDAEEVLGVSAKERKERASRQEEAGEWLRELLNDGPVQTETIEAEARKSRISWRTLRRAKDRLGVQHHKSSIGGKYYWELPEARQEVGQHALHK